MLLLAALLIFATGLIHSYLGERYLLAPLFRRDNLPKLLGSVAFTTGTLRFAWHLTTLAWWGIGVLLVLTSQGPLSQPLLLQVVGWTALASALLPLAFTRGRHLSWLVLLAVAALAFLSA